MKDMNDVVSYLNNVLGSYHDLTIIAREAAKILIPEEVEEVTQEDEPEEFVQTNVGQLTQRFVDLYMTESIDFDAEMLESESHCYPDLEFDHNGHIMNESLYNWVINQLNEPQDYLSYVISDLEHHFYSEEMKLILENEDKVIEKLKIRLKQVLVDI